MTQRILSLLLLGAILIGTTTAVTRDIAGAANQALATQERIAGEKNRQVLGLREALADYERAKLEGVK